jgi:hypothetical protein
MPYTSFAAWSFAPRRAVVHVVEVVFERVETGDPEGAIRCQPVIDLAERVGSKSIEASLRGDANLDHPRIAQHPKVLGDRGLTHREPIHDFGDRPLTCSQHVKDSPPVGFRHHLECCRHGVGEYALTLI